ncbi:ankyrin-3 [Lingula anatina]|uniref:Ankyrin-3 n=1 Tax=Lingula anatina TaxID=7574 RepID=A0A1S3IAY0_LINAN|nr:ankyrin-3 [Lingula anatina]|eukprot:XP_013395417.1 ankyrin-3 [Lingula anatina]
MAASGPETKPWMETIHVAAEFGDIDTVRRLLESNICGVDERGGITRYGRRTPLHCAAQGGHCGVAALLIQLGADPCSTTCYGRTPLHFAAEGGHCDVAALLIQHRADPCSKDMMGRTPLHDAASCDVADLLIQQGADFRSKDMNGFTPLHYAALGGHCDVAALLIQCGANFRSKDKSGCIPLHCAASRGHCAVAALLIQHGTDVCSKDKEGYTPLHYAAEVGQCDVAALLIQHEADICSKHKGGWTPLHCATWDGHSDVAELLIQRGADPCSEDKGGWTPLHCAASRGHCAVAALLIQHGADVCSKDKGGWTPLHCAAWDGHSDVADLLIQHGADPCSKEDNDRTPLHHAASGGHCAVAALLIQHGADVCSKDKDGCTPLHSAAKAGYEAALLIQQGADSCSKSRGDLERSGEVQLLLKKFESGYIQQFMITKTLEHVSADMSLGINNNFPDEVQRQAQGLKDWRNANNFKTIQEIKAGLLAQGREELCELAAEQYATVVMKIINMSTEHYQGFCEGLSTAQFMLQERQPAALETQSQEIGMELESYKYDAFLIHSGEDNSKVEEVLEQLESRGIRCCYAPRDFQLGRSIFSCIDDAVESSRCTVVMVSENFMKSTWCKHERDVAEVKARDTEGYLMIPVLLDFEPSDLPRTYKARKFVRADCQDFIPKLAKAIEGPTAAPCYGQLRRENEALKQEMEGMSQQLEDSNSTIRQLRANLESFTLYY